MQERVDLYPRGFEAVQKSRSRVLKTRGKPTVFKPDNTLLLILEKVHNKINNDPQ